ncbi:MAG: HNH endonuclease [Candidatus Aenigmarchaeota archaeon]|nr:HNH endonuclease [Candidatus Aenigmarchaeota archaeon]
MTPRQQIRKIIPDEYHENERNGLCRVCGKTRDQWEKRRSVFCSEECSKKYQKCFYTWAELRAKILKERGANCEKCNKDCSADTHELELDHITALVNGGDMWDESNLQLLCNRCHRKKTTLDLRKARFSKIGQKVLSSTM